MRITLDLESEPRATVGDLQFELIDVIHARVEREGIIDHVPRVQLRVTRGAESKIVRFEREADVFGRHVTLDDAMDAEVVLEVSE